MDVAIFVAIVALVAAILGATIGAGTNYILAVRRERAGRERDDRNHAVEVKRAARLIDLELMWVWIAAGWVRAAANQRIEEKRWSSAAVPLLPLSTEARQKYIDTIAPDLSDEDWTSVTIALQAAETIRVILGIPGDRAIAVPDDVAESLVPLLTNINKGRLGLAPYQLDFQAAGKSTQ